MQEGKIRVAIIGVTGHTGEELLRILIRHKFVEIAYLSSTTQESFPITDVYPWAPDNLKVEPFDVQRAKQCDCVFLALPHTVSMEYACKILPGPKVIDLSADFRFSDISLYEKWYAKHTCASLVKNAVYGLCDVFNEEIKSADLIANPGCYPTAVLLGLMPLVRCGVFSSCIIDAKSGASGAGRKVNNAMMFMSLAENMYAYKVNSHQHAPEMSHILKVEESSIVFIPHIVGIRRGILANIYTELNKNLQEGEIYRLFYDFYDNSKFVRVVEHPPKLSDVQNTNYCLIHIKSLSKERVLIISAIDNIMKGASGQAIENMNLLFNFPEEEGLL